MENSDIIIRRSLGTGQFNVKASLSTYSPSMEAMNQRQKFGPFAVHQVFPLNAEHPILIYNLSLRSRNKGSVGLDRIREIRAQEEEEDVDDINLIQWRALVPINLKSNDEFTPRLSPRGRLLVHAHAASKKKQLGTRFVIIVQGLTRRYIWGGSRTAFCTHCTSHSPPHKIMSLRHPP